MTTTAQGGNMTLQKQCDFAKYFLFVKGKQYFICQGQMKYHSVLFFYEGLLRVNVIVYAGNRVNIAYVPECYYCLLPIAY